MDNIEELSNFQEKFARSETQVTPKQKMYNNLIETLLQTRISTDTEVPPKENALSIDDKGFFALRDIHAIKAKPKSGKTTALKVFAAALLRGDIFRIKSLLPQPRILFFDTEQSRTDVKHILEDITQITGLSKEIIDNQVMLHALRRCDCDQLLPMLRNAIMIMKPNVVFIDGIVEFVNSFNDEAESKRVVKELLVLCEEYNCAIVCILHTNKAGDDHNMRGHLGSMLAQKAGTVLECKKNRGIITVSCSDTRHAEIPEWSFTFDENGHIVDADERYRKFQEQYKNEEAQKRIERGEKEKKERLDKCITILRENGGIISRKQLTENLANVLERDRSTVSSYISQWLKEKSVIDVNGMIQAPDNLTLNFKN